MKNKTIGVLVLVQYIKIISYQYLSVTTRLLHLLSRI